MILNNTRTPDTNRSDLMALIGGCRAAERRVVEICERFGRDTFAAACDALLERTREPTYRVQAFRRAATAIRELTPDELASRVAAGSLEKLANVGPKTAKVIDQAKIKPEG